MVFTDRRAFGELMKELARLIIGQIAPADMSLTAEGGGYVVGERA